MMLVPFTIWAADELAKITVFGGTSRLYKNLECLYIKIRNNVENDNSEAVSYFLSNAYKALIYSYSIPTNDISKYYDSSTLKRACNTLKENYPSMDVDLEKFMVFIDEIESKSSFALTMLETLILESNQFLCNRPALLLPKSNIEQVKSELADTVLDGYFHLLDKKTYFESGFNSEIIFLGPINWFKQYLKLPNCKAISVIQPAWYRRTLKSPNIFKVGDNFFGFDSTVSDFLYAVVDFDEVLNSISVEDLNEEVSTSQDEIKSPYVDFKITNKTGRFRYFIEVNTGFFNVDSGKNQYFITDFEAYELSFSNIYRLQENDYVIELQPSKELEKFVSDEDVSWEEEMDAWKKPLRKYTQLNILEKKLKKLGADSEAIGCNIRTWMKPAETTLNAPRSESNLRAVLTLARISAVFHDYYIELVNEIRLNNRLQGRKNNKTRKAYVLNKITKWFKENTIADDKSEVEAEFGRFTIEKVKVVHIEPY